jgi:GT2 family glycosyltransferase
MARTHEWLRLIRNDHNEGYLESVNRGAEAATGEILVFLNNDTISVTRWISALVGTFRAFPDAGVVGGKLLYPDGRMQEAGGMVFRDGSAAKFGAFDPALTAPIYNFVRDVDYCSGALLATPRALFEQLGGFDPAYGPGYYEDTDYCFRVREQGLRVIYQPASVVVHVEGGTAGMDVSTGMKRYQVLNHDRFVERWHATLATLPERPPEPFDALDLFELSRPASATTRQP